MTRSLGSDLPARLQLLLDGHDPGSHVGTTFLLLTSTEANWPHAAMLSVGEVLCVTPRELRLALWPSSTTTRNLTSRSRATIVLVHEAAGYLIRCRATRGPDLELRSRPAGLASFALEVAEVFEDVVPYAELTNGITFELTDVHETVEDWCEQLEALRRGA
ncbi:MAG: pyridoxamine 5'-phosphate oxidase family protein [Gaiellales bacterium]